MFQHLKSGQTAVFVALVAALALAACSSDDDNGGGGASDDVASGVDAGGATDMGGGEEDAGGGTTDIGGGMADMGGDNDAASGPKSIVEIVLGTPRFSTLAQAAGASDSIPAALSAAGPFTVFAPNNDAFAMIPEAALNEILADGELLDAILSYHVLDAEVMAKDVAAGLAETLVGVDVKIAVVEGKVYINDAEVVMTDIEASNGVIHEIDTVLLPPDDIPAVAAEAGSFATLVAALGAAELAPALEGEGPFTVFAPTDDAFAKLPEAQIELLLKPENKDLLQRILKYHVVPAKVAAANVAAGEVETLDGSKLTITIGNDGGVMVDGANVTATDVIAANGVIHVIDRVILPPLNVVETARITPGFGTLVAALGAADLGETLSGEGPFTVFAPNDAAFAMLDSGVLEDLLKPENKTTLANILLYHVVAGQKVDAQTAATLVGQAVATAHPDALTFTVTDEDGLGLAGGDGSSAKIIATDVDATNGTIHVLDAVIMPPTPM